MLSFLWQRSPLFLFWLNVTIKQHLHSIASCLTGCPTSCDQLHNVYNILLFDQPVVKPFVQLVILCKRDIANDITQIGWSIQSDQF